jgi:hypothetical protein
VLGEAGLQTDPCDGQLHSYPVNLPVQAGDVVGVYVVTKWEGVLSLNSGVADGGVIPEPAVGDTVTLTNHLAVTIDESATLVAPPSAQISSPADNQTFNQNESVQSTFSCTDDSDGPGIQSCGDSNGTSGTTGTLHGTLDTSSVGAHTYTVTATSKDGLTATAIVHYTVIGSPTASINSVMGPPTASISSPANNQTFSLDQSIPTTFSCMQASGGASIQSCADSNRTSGTTGTLHGTLDTSSVGAHTYTVTATSRDGLVGRASITYTVVAMKVSIISSRARYKGGRTEIKLICTGPAGGVCRGMLTLKERVRRTVFRMVHGTQRAESVFETIVLGRHAYSLAAGKTAFVTVRLANGLLRTIHARATASVHGGTKATRNLTLVPAARPSRANDT